DNAVATYEKLIGLGMKEPSIYTSLANIFLEQNQLEKADKILQDGLNMFPGNLDMVISMANFYIKSKQHQKALQSLTMAKEKDPSNKSIAFAIGVTYDMLKNDTTLPATDRSKYFDSAVKSYEETISLDPQYFDALFNLGAVFFNKGGDIINEANRLPLGDKKYDGMIADGNNMLNKALPYLEKAEQIKVGDRDTLISLKEIYTRLGQYEKLKEVNEKLGN
ncbi:MAG TPA: tetratricopeptide repeat protein, partial [Bacteroidales bacterium]|nr:tetratricopeptide repeat protein [Bacteroidales bacterium]